MLFHNFERKCATDIKWLDETCKQYMTSTAWKKPSYRNLARSKIYIMFLKYLVMPGNYTLLLVNINNVNKTVN